MSDKLFYFSLCTYDFSNCLPQGFLLTENCHPKPFVIQSCCIWIKMSHKLAFTFAIYLKQFSEPLGCTRLLFARRKKVLSLLLVIANQTCFAQICRRGQLRRACLPVRFSDVLHCQLSLSIVTLKLSLPVLITPEVPSTLFSCEREFRDNDKLIRPVRCELITVETGEKNGKKRRKRQKNTGELRSKDRNHRTN